MPRHAGPFQLVLRRDTGGRPVYYVRFRNEDDELLSWTSTGETSKTAARAWADKHRKDATTNRVLTFARYAEKWWTPEHEYIRGKIARGKHVSRSYCDNQRRNLEKYILPAFGSKRLAAIKTGSIETWCMSLGEHYRLGPVAVNHVLRCLKTMLAEARRLGLMSANPAADVAPLQEPKKQRQVLTLAEIAQLFDEATTPTVWASDERAYTGALIGVSCGLRLGEIQGLTAGSVQEGYLVVSHAWERLRHTFNSIMHGKVPDHVLAAMTGHKTPRMVDHYTSPTPDDLQDALEAQEATFGTVAPRRCGRSFR